MNTKDILERLVLCATRTLVRSLPCASGVPAYARLSVGLARKDGPDMVHMHA